MTKTLACQIYVALLLILRPLSLADAADAEWKPIHITGRVVDTNGRPIKGVMCFWQLPEWSEWPDSATEIVTETVSDADGRFELREHEITAKDPIRRAGGFLWFYSDGYAVHWQPYDQLSPVSSNRRNLDVMLKPAKPFSYRVVDPDGRPRVGELIEPIRLATKQMTIPPPRAIREGMSGTTDEAGLFVVNGLSAEQGMMVRVMSERFGTIQQSPSFQLGASGIVTLKLRRVGDVEGMVEIDRPEVLAGRRIQLTTTWPPQNPDRFFGTTEAIIDAHGRFRASAVPEGDLSAYIESLPGDEYGMSPSQDQVAVKAGGLVKLTVSTVRRVPITGRVRTSDGRVPEGVGEVIVPENGLHREIKGRLNRDGDFQISVYPGEVKIRTEFRTLNGIPVASETLVAETMLVTKTDAPSANCPDLVLPKSRIVEGRAVASDGQPLVGATLFVQFGKRSGVVVKTDAVGRFQYAVAENTPPGEYTSRRGDRFSMLQRTDDPSVIQLPAGADDTAGH